MIRMRVANIAIMASALALAYASSVSANHTKDVCYYTQELDIPNDSASTDKTYKSWSEAGPCDCAPGSKNLGGGAKTTWNITRVDYDSSNCIGNYLDTGSCSWRPATNPCSLTGAYGGGDGSNVTMNQFRMVSYGNSANVTVNQAVLDRMNCTNNGGNWDIINKVCR